MTARIINIHDAKLKTVSIAVKTRTTTGDNHRKREQQT
jgi:hypothetical protein